MGFYFLLQCMKVKSESEVAQSCPTLSDPMDCSPPGSSVHGIFQARVGFSSGVGCQLPSDTAKSPQWGKGGHTIAPQLSTPALDYDICRQGLQSIQL